MLTYNGAMYQTSPSSISIIMYPTHWPRKGPPNCHDQKGTTVSVGGRREWRGRARAPLERAAVSTGHAARTHASRSVVSEQWPHDVTRGLAHRLAQTRDLRVGGLHLRSTQYVRQTWVKFLIYPINNRRVGILMPLLLDTNGFYT